MATAEKCVYVFTSKLGCKKNVSDPVLSESEESSMLPCFLDDESSRCTFPSLQLGKCSCLKPSEEEAVEELKSSLEARKGTIALAPTALLQNVTKSFGTLIDNRIKQFHLMMLANADNDDRGQNLNLRLASLLCSEKSCPTTFISAESSFRPLTLSKGHVKEVGRIKAVILPLVFKTTITINILGTKQIKITLTAPGTIVGTFMGSCTRLRTAEVTLDTSAIYSSMKQRCDQVVATTFETAAHMMDAPSSPEPKAQQVPEEEPVLSRIPSSCRVKRPVQNNERLHHPISP